MTLIILSLFVHLAVTYVLAQILFNSVCAEKNMQIDGVVFFL